MNVYSQILLSLCIIISQIGIGVGCYNEGRHKGESYLKDEVDEIYKQMTDQNRTFYVFQQMWARNLHYQAGHPFPATGCPECFDIIAKARKEGISDTELVDLNEINKIKNRIVIERNKRAAK